MGRFDSGCLVCIKLGLANQQLELSSSHLCIWNYTAATTISSTDLSSGWNLTGVGIIPPIDLMSVGDLSIGIPVTGMHVFRISIFPFFSNDAHLRPWGQPFWASKCSRARARCILLHVAASHPMRNGSLGRELPDERSNTSMIANMFITLSSQL
jgi:hypothetical protein